MGFMEQMTAAMPLKVDVLSVSPVEQLHPHRQVRLRRLDKQVFVIGHQAERVQLPAVLANHPRQPFKPPTTVRIVPHDATAVVAATDDMVQRPGKLDSEGACHRQRLRRRPNGDKANG